MTLGIVEGDEKGTRFLGIYLATLSMGDINTET
jgi:hypothetical protein